MGPSERPGPGRAGNLSFLLSSKVYHADFGMVHKSVDTFAKLAVAGNRQNMENKGVQPRTILFRFGVKRVSEILSHFSQIEVRRERNRYFASILKFIKNFLHCFGKSRILLMSLIRGIRL